MAQFQGIFESSFEFALSPFLKDGQFVAVELFDDGQFALSVSVKIFKNDLAGGNIKKAGDLPLAVLTNSAVSAFGAAEIKISHSAPSSIWVFSVPEESKL